MELLESLLNLIFAVLEVLAALVKAIAPWWPLIAWVAFWTLGVNWVTLRRYLFDGGWVGVVLIGLVMVLVWGCVAPPEGGSEAVFGLKLSNFVEKTVWVTGLIVIMLLCGSVQLSGACDRYLCFEEPQPEGDSGDHDAGDGH